MVMNQTPSTAFISYRDTRLGWTTPVRARNSCLNSSKECELSEWSVLSAISSCSVRSYA